MKLLVYDVDAAVDKAPFADLEAVAEVCFAADDKALREHLPGTEILLLRDAVGAGLQACWERADSLQWIHRCGVGVDAVLFPELRDSGVTVTNASGVFDHAIAEYVLGYMLYTVKKFLPTRRAQSEHRWEHRLTGTLAGQRAAVFGVGGIGREIARLLQMMDMQLIGVGRTRRSADAQFGEIQPIHAAREIVATVDWAIAVLPATPDSEGIFDTAFFAALNPGAHFINVGRGCTQDEAALAAALTGGRLAGAMIDVFCAEPLAAESALWDVPNLFISPHMSGDYAGFQQDLLQQFRENLHRYMAGAPLQNTVDKKLGFISARSASAAAR